MQPADACGTESATTVGELDLARKLIVPPRMICKMPSKCDALYGEAFVWSISP